MTTPDEHARAEVRQAILNAARYVGPPGTQGTAGLAAFEHARDSATIRVMWADESTPAAEVSEQTIEAGREALRATCCTAEDCDRDHPVNWMSMTGDAVTGVEGDVDEIVRVVLTAAAPLIRAQADAEVERLNIHLKVVGDTLVDVGDERDSLRAEVERLRALTETCTCPGHPNYDGPQADCAVHGAIRALGEAVREEQRLRAELAEAEDAMADYAAAVDNERARVLAEVDSVLRDAARFEAWLSDLKAGGWITPIRPIDRAHIAQYLRDAIVDVGLQTTPQPADAPPESHGDGTAGSGAVVGTDEAPGAPEAVSGGRRFATGGPVESAQLYLVGDGDELVPIGTPSEELAKVIKAKAEALAREAQRWYGTKEGEKP